MDFTAFHWISKVFPHIISIFPALIDFFFFPSWIGSTSHLSPMSLQHQKLQVSPHVSGMKSPPSQSRWGNFYKNQRRKVQLPLLRESGLSRMTESTSIHHLYAYILLKSNSMRNTGLGYCTNLQQLCCQNVFKSWNQVQLKRPSAAVHRVQNGFLKALQKSFFPFVRLKDTTMYCTKLTLSGII